MSSTTTIFSRSSYATTLLSHFIRFWLTICTILFLLNTANVLYLRNSATPTSTLIQESDKTHTLHSHAARVYIITSTRTLPFLTQHVWPVPLWLFLMFAQLSTYIRQRHLRLHRVLGRLSIGVTIYMMLSVFWILATATDLNGPVGFSLNLRYPREVFSFWSCTMVFGIYWIYCLYKMYRTASWKTIQEHKYWALHFVATGFGSGSFRVIAVAYMISLRYYYPEYQIDLEAHKAMMGYLTWIGFSGPVMFVDLLMSTGIVEVTKGRNGKQP